MLATYVPTICHNYMLNQASHSSQPNRALSELQCQFCFSSFLSTAAAMRVVIFTRAYSCGSPWEVKRLNLSSCSYYLLGRSNLCILFAV